MVQTGANTASGGVQDGFANIGYQSRTPRAVARAASPPTARQSARAVIKAAAERPALGRRTGAAPPALSAAAMRRREVQYRADRHDLRRVDGTMAHVIMAFDVIEPHGPGDARKLIEIAREAPQVRVLVDVAQVALEVAVIDGVEADQRREEPYVGLGQPVAQQIAPAAAQPLLQPVQRPEQG